MLNCGPCGECSNEQDVGVYIATATNLTALVRSCGTRLIPGRRNACLDAIGFTSGCKRCYEENILCDRRHCLGPCLAFLVRSWFTGSSHGQEHLGSNPCLACDEARCGPAFLACAGANRRRAGIVSDIARLDAEQCTVAVNYRSQK